MGTKCFKSPIYRDILVFSFVPFYPLRGQILSFVPSSMSFKKGSKRNRFPSVWAFTVFCPLMNDSGDKFSHLSLLCLLKRK